MNQAEFEAIKATFPWREQVIHIPGAGGLIQLIDCNGNEVPLFTMTAFLGMITNKLAKPAEKEAA